MEYDICEIYVWDNIKDVNKVINNFTRACKFLINKGVRQFIICNENNCTNLCYEILKQYSNNYDIEIKIINQTYNPSKIKGYTILFNLQGQGIVAIYDKSIMPILLTNGFNSTYLNNSFFEVDLLD